MSGKNDKITMKDHAIAKKEGWLHEVGTVREIHTVVLDHRDKFSGGENKDLASGHEIYYKRGVGAFRLSSMQRVENHQELMKFMGMKEADLPEKARGPKR